MMQAAHVLNLLESPPTPLTVFAPNNAAFAAALKALNLTAEQLLANTDLVLKVTPALRGSTQAAFTAALVGILYRIAMHHKLRNRSTASVMLLPCSQARLGMHHACKNAPTLLQH